MQRAQNDLHHVAEGQRHLLQEADSHNVCITNGLKLVAASKGHSNIKKAKEVVEVHHDLAGIVHLRENL